MCKYHEQNAYESAQFAGVGANHLFRMTPEHRKGAAPGGFSVVVEEMVGKGERFSLQRKVGHMNEHAADRF